MATNVESSQNTDGLNEKLIAVNRVARSSGRPAVRLHGADRGRRWPGPRIGFGYARPVKCRSRSRRRWRRRAEHEHDRARRHHAAAPLNGEHGAARVFMQPASEGTGIIAGGAMRAVFEVLGVRTYWPSASVPATRSTSCARRSTGSGHGLAGLHRRQARQESRRDPGVSHVRLGQGEGHACQEHQRSAGRNNKALCPRSRTAPLHPSKSIPRKPGMINKVSYLLKVEEA